MIRVKAGVAQGQAIMFALLVIGYPIIASVSPILGLENRLVSVPYRFLIALASLPFVYQGAQVMRTLSRLNQVILCAYGAFWGVYVTRLFYDVYVMEMPTTIDTLQYFLYTLFICLIPSLVFVKPLLPSIETLIARLLIVGGSLAGVLLLAVVTTLTPLQQAYLSGVGRLATETANPIMVGYLGVVIGTSMIFLLLYPDENKIVRYITYGVTAPVMILALYLLGASASKGPILSLLIGIATIFIGSWFRNDEFVMQRRRWIALGSLVIPVVLVVSLFIAEYSFGFKAISRFSSSFSEDDTTNATGSIRINFFGEALDHFWKNPLFGNSIFVNSRDPYPHNIFIECLMVGGILLLALYGVYMAFCLYGIVRQVLAGKYTLIAAIFFVYLWQSFSSGAVATSNELWGLSVAVLAVSRWSADAITPAPSRGTQPIESGPMESGPIEQPG